MESAKEITAHERQAFTVERVLRELLGDVMQRDFYGRASVEVVISDGAVQRIYRRIERTEK